MVWAREQSSHFLVRGLLTGTMSYAVVQANQVQTNALQSVSEKAHGIKYTESLKTGWQPPKHIRNMNDVQAEVLDHTPGCCKEGSRCLACCGCGSGDLRCGPRDAERALTLFLWLLTENPQEVLHRLRGRGAATPHRALRGHALPQAHHGRPDEQGHQAANAHPGTSRSISALHPYLHRGVAMWPDEVGVLCLCPAGSGAAGAAERSRHDRHRVHGVGQDHHLLPAAHHARARRGEEDAARGRGRARGHHHVPGQRAGGPDVRGAGALL